MTSHYTTYCKNASHHPYVSKVPIEKVDFIYQFVKNVKECCIHDYKYRNPYIQHICGPPTTFPNYEDFSHTLFGDNAEYPVTLSPWKKDARFHKPLNHKEIFNYLEITFHEAVYPIRVSLYETRNPGCIIQICAEYSNNAWCLLWDGWPQTVRSKSRIFSPPLDLKNFKTKKLRLYFYQGLLPNYYTMLDAVMLIGTSEMISPRNSKENLTELLRKINYTHTHHEDVNNLTPDYENANLDIDQLQNNFHKYCIIGERCKIISQKVLTVDASPISQTESHRTLEEISSNHAKYTLISEKLTRCSFSALSDEIILKILKKLDLTTLSRMSQVNKRFYNLTQDPFLYTCLNMRNLFNSSYVNNILCYFKPKCKYLKQLDLTKNHFSVEDFVLFIENCGKHLTHLRLSYCDSVNNHALHKISEICTKLKEVDLRNCCGIDNMGLSHLKNLKNLEYLRLVNIYKLISSETLYEILQSNQQMRELNLNILNIFYNLDDTYDLRIPCQSLEIIHLEGLRNLTSENINVLANCKNLRKVNLVFKKTIAEDSLDRLFSTCQFLKEVHLTLCILTDRHLKFLTQCKDLEYLYLYYIINTQNRSHERCGYLSNIFELCPRVQFYFINCNINSSLAEQWMEKYPHVFIKTNSQTNSDAVWTSNIDYYLRNFHSFPL